MTTIEVTKFILSRGEDWALVKYRTASGVSGTCGGRFSCQTYAIVPGQYYVGRLSKKRSRSGEMQTNFSGRPKCRRAHAFKKALKDAGINYLDRATVFSGVKPLKRLFHLLESNKKTELSQLPSIGKKKLARIFEAYGQFKMKLIPYEVMQRMLPSLFEYMNENQIQAAMLWMGKHILDEGSPMERWITCVCDDPWRIVYGPECTSFGYEDESRKHFLKKTTHKSRLKMAECVAKDLKIGPSDPRRRRFQAIRTINEHMKRTGDYWLPLGKFLSMMQCREVQPDWPVVIHDGHCTLVKFSEIEAVLGDIIELVKMQEQPQWKLPSPESRLDEHQRNAVEMACHSPVFVLYGGAGVGKTSVCKEIVECLHNHVTCAAPTGKAAQRMTEVTGVTAQTVHRLYYGNLDVHDTLLLDEQSMQEPEILARLLKKYLFKKIIFVGDVGQLTSVGPGQFLRDLVASDVPSVELTTIYRSGPESYIASNGLKIRNGETDLDTSPESFEIHRYNSDAQIVAEAKAIYDATTTMPMVLCNTNAEIAELNIELRKLCNKPGTRPQTDKTNLDYIASTARWRYPEWRFSEGDQVINVTNKYIEVQKPGCEKPVVELQVANGEVGFVRHANKDRISVYYPYAGHVGYSVKDDANDYLRPAYALTVNKAQGSEYPHVIVKSVASWGDKRERFYTAITRAKKKCIVFEVGNANTQCILANPAHRKTYLFKRHIDE